MSISILRCCPIDARFNVMQIGLRLRHWFEAFHSSLHVLIVISLLLHYASGWKGC